MSKVVLISCGSKKMAKRSMAKDMYLSPLFKNSLAYAYSLNPDKIYILSALYHVLDLEQEIEPYNVTLSNILKLKRKNGLIVLNAKEKKVWGEKVIQQLSELVDLANDDFVILAGNEYIKPLKKAFSSCTYPLNGVNLFNRPRVLKELIRIEIGKTNNL